MPRAPDVDRPRAVHVGSDPSRTGQTLYMCYGIARSRFASFQAWLMTGSGSG